MSPAECPNHNQIADYLVGRLDDEDSQRLADHLESCPGCQAELDSMDEAEDTLVAGLRAPVEADPFVDESECDAAVARVKEVAGRSDSAAPPVSSTLPVELGEYRLLKELGRGGMGTVYQALHTKLDRVVAVKVLAKSRLNDEGAIARFEREMKAVGRLDNSHIVSAHDAREIDGMPVLVMQYVEGLDLAEIVKRIGPLQSNDASELIRQAAVGLQYAHEHGLVHRDVKPSNLMLGLGSRVEGLGSGAEGVGSGVEGKKAGAPAVKLLDLGLARFHAEPHGRDEVTGTGQTMGTADYMAPEQVSDSRQVDIRADIYSLGCTLYKLLAGRAPFSGPEFNSAFEKLNAHVHKPVPPVREFAPELPDDLVAILDRMLAKDPSDRFATPAEVAAAIEPLCAGNDLSSLLRRAQDAPKASDEEHRVFHAADKASYPQAVVPSPKPDRGRRIPVALAIGLMFVCIAMGLVAGIVIRIKMDGRSTEVDVPVGSKVTIDENGDLDVSLLPGASPISAARTGAEADREAIQGTWQLVSSSMKLFEFSTARAGTTGHRQLPASTKDITQNTRIVITDDTFKVLGKYQVNETYEYRANPEASPKLIDLQAGGKVGLGIYDLDGDELKICVAVARPTGSSTPVGPPPRPTEFWADMGSDKDLLVLRRFGEPTIEEDERDIQGRWEVVFSSTLKPGDPDFDISRYSTHTATKGQRVEITRHAFRFSSAHYALPTEQRKAMGFGVFPWMMYAGHELGYAIDSSESPKKIDFVFIQDTDNPPSYGIYELEEDLLRLCIGAQRPMEISPEAAKGQVSLVLRRAAVPEQSDEEGIRGTWQVTSITRQGQMAEAGHPTTLTFSEYGCEAVMEDKTRKGFTYALDSGYRQGTIHLHHVVDQPEGKFSIKTSHGRYSLREDRLHFAWLPERVGEFGGPFFKVGSMNLDRLFPEKAGRPDPAGMELPQIMGLPDGYQVYPVQITPEPEEQQEISPGDRVDILLDRALSGIEPGSREPAIPIIQDLEVFFGQSMFGGGGGFGQVTVAVQPIEIQLLVTPTQAAKLALVRSLGKFRLVPHDSEKADDASDAAESSAREAIQGRWKVVDFKIPAKILSGEALADNESLGMSPKELQTPCQYLITPDQFLAWSSESIGLDQAIKSAIGYTADPTSTPKSFDFLQFGETVSRAIYQIEGDRIRIHYASDPGLGRPVDFEFDPDSTSILLELQRVATMEELFLDISVTLDGKAEVEGRATDEDTLKEILKFFLGVNPKLKVRLSAHPEVLHRQTVRWMNLVQDAGVKDIAFLVAASDEDSTDESQGSSRDRPALDLRIAPICEGDAKPKLQEDEIQQYVNKLTTHGAEGQSPGAAYEWFELVTNPASHLITADHQGKRYILLSARTGGVMLAGDTGPLDWRFQNVELTETEGGRPGIGVELDEAGSRRLLALTESHIGSPLAIVVDNRVVSIPTIRNKISKRVEITGDFDSVALQEILDALRAGMSKTD